MPPTPLTSTEHFIIPSDYLTPNCLAELCDSLHFARIEKKQSIFSAAAAAGISYQELDALERGECRELDLVIFLRLFKVYNQKLLILPEN